jgi:HSP20 family protein
MNCMTRCTPRTAKVKNEEATATQTPRIDILDRDDAVLLFADMPGVGPNDVDIRFENGELSIHGKRNYHLPDRPTESLQYFRNFTLGEQIATDKIQAEMKHGVLALTLPKVEAVKPRKIQVHG